MIKAEFEQMYHAFFTAMCLYAEKFTGDRQTAEDLAEDVFAKIWEYGDIKKISNLQAYLYRTMRNACLDYLKAQQRQSNTHSSPEYMLLNFPDTDYELIRIEVRRQMEMALLDLPENYGKVLKMAYLDQLSGKEIATQLGLSLSSVKKNKAKGLSMLRVLMGKSSLSLLIMLLN